MEEIESFPVRTTESEAAEYAEPFGVTQRQRLVGQVIRHYSGQVASTLSSIILVPILLQRLGSEAYGFWLVALSTPGFASGLDNAIYLSITRETALFRSEGKVLDAATRTFLSACCGAYAAFGILCAFGILIAGNLLARRLHLSSEILKSVPVVIGAVAIGFATSRIVVFANAVLSGLQRFGTINAISAGTLIVRFAGFVALSRSGSLYGIAVWYALTAMAESIAALSLAARFGAIRTGRALLEWRRLGHVGSFGVTSFFTTALQNIFWFSPPALLGILTGQSSSAFLLYAGQRPCTIVSDLNWRGAEVLFSASAGAGADDRKAEDRELMVFGTTCILTVAFPLCVGLAMLAPALVSTWLRTPSEATVLVMRLTAAGVVADALWVGPLHILWGKGLAQSVLWISSGLAAGALLLNVLLIPHYGAVGAAITFAILSWIVAIVTLHLAARQFSASWIQLLFRSVMPLGIPAISLLAFLAVISTALHAHPQILLFTAAAGGASLYFVLLWVQNRRPGNQFMRSPFQFEQLRKTDS